MSDRDGSLSVALVRSVAELTGREVSSLPPLHESIDPDALERLFEPTATGPRIGTIEFRYAGYLVTVARATDFMITLEDIEPTDENETSSPG
ncbi:HalOD1 output domain-containing protein [Natronococcus pandeyae]|uniref:HalOD1 output domain-containing protein n=1 Tax=Natronococcus pandeyae TaxID=2055836 RepID=UPI001F1A0220|nr:HalOD1 output domain-containing protein [Natronococcus pandeyae]